MKMHIEVHQVVIEFLRKKLVKLGNICGNNYKNKGLLKFITYHILCFFITKGLVILLYTLKLGHFICIYAFVHD